MPLLASPPTAQRFIVGLTAVVLTVVLAVNVPCVLRTALECDPIIFDLYVRDIARGKVLYRDMLENNTPTMIALHAGIRHWLGHSSEAIRIVDLCIVGAGIGLLAWWFHPGRLDRRLITFTVLCVLYLSSSEWCHVQRDVWLSLPVMTAMYLRRTNLTRQLEARVSLAGVIVEGIVWGLAVWLKPHMAIIGFTVWLVGMTWARGRRATWRAGLLDAVGLLIGGVLIGAIGIGLMIWAGVWGSYYHHLTTWAAEYPGADMYGPWGRWVFRMIYVYTNMPWSAVYVVMLPAAVVMAGTPFARWVTGQPPADRPDQALLGAALVSWAIQAWGLQHVFDYTHVTAELMAMAILTNIGFGAASRSSRAIWTFGVISLTVIGHANAFTQRLGVWSECVRPDPSPELRDRLARYPNIGWADLHAAADWLQAHEVRDGELNVFSDTGLPIWEMTGLSPPTRYYILQNNMMAYRSHREEIMAAVEAVPYQRYVLCDLRALVWEVPAGCDPQHPEDWPLSASWYGPRRWADRVVFRAGRIVIVAIPASEVRAWMTDVSDLKPNPADEKITHNDPPH